MPRRACTTLSVLPAFFASAWLLMAPGRQQASPLPSRQVQGRQLTATLGASSDTLAPGRPVRLTLDIDLEPNMHVYAPGVDGYIPIEWKMDDSAGVQMRAPIFPRAEKLYLRAIDETVPAYRSHFRLVREITVSPGKSLKPITGASAHITVSGSLRYQACDDRVCYIPQTLKLQWTFAPGGAHISKDRLTGPVP